MKKILFALLLTLTVFTFSFFAQTVETVPPENLRPEEKRVEVTQKFVDDAAKAFDLIAANRTALEKYANDEKNSLIEREQARILIKGYDELLAIKDRTISAVEKLTALYERAVALQERILDRYEKYFEEIDRRGRNKNSLWKQIKQVFTVVGIVIGIRRAGEFISGK